MPNRTPNAVMDVKECADYLGVSIDTMYRYAQEGTIPAFRLGNRWRFRLARVDEWMDRQSGPKSLQPPGA